MPASRRGYSLVLTWSGHVAELPGWRQLHRGYDQSIELLAAFSANFGGRIQVREEMNASEVWRRGSRVLTWWCNFGLPWMQRSGNILEQANGTWLPDFHRKNRSAQCCQKVFRPWVEIHRKNPFYNIHSTHMFLKLSFNRSIY